AATALSLPGARGPPLPTPSHGPGGTFSITCAARIAATPDACLDVIVSASEYPKWNRFIRKCVIDSAAADSAKLRLHTPFTFHVWLDPSAPDGAPASATSALEVSALERIDDDGAASPPPGFPSLPRARAPLAETRRGWRIAWRPRSSWRNAPLWLLRSERVQELVEVDGGRATQYYCWETFYGPLAPLVRRLTGRQVERGFDAWMEGLRGMVEG
ncbi:uncharacterized protein THITE_26762, partial [Thermothielavioides terrestris NRRL 8126]